jgi:hypothetical protein
MLQLMTRGAALAAILALSVPALADDGTPVLVQFPSGLSAGFVTTEPAKDDAFKYVSIASLTIANPSREFAQAYKLSQFHLLVGEKTYYPAVRPGLDALDLSQDGLLGPAQVLRRTVTFKVPVAVTKAQFEFTPHWQSEAGSMVDYCCDYR